jgi:ABC-2 type transport system permease protein
MAGLAWSILDDRERYRMLKYLYVSPIPMLVLLLGRGTARLGIAAMATAVTLVVGVLFLGLGFDPAVVDWPMLLASMALGLGAVVSLGVILAATVMQTRQEAWSYPEAVAGAMFLVVGAIFPLAVLPFAVQLVGLAIPLTWWLEGVRQALFPSVVSSVGGEGSAWTTLTGTSVPDQTALLVMLSLTTALTMVVAVAVYRWSEHRAKERGLFDQTTGS